MASLIAFLQALPYLIQLLVQFMGLVARIASWAQTNSLHKWMENLEDTIDQLEKAKTPDEKRDVARKLSDIIKSFG